MIGADLDRAIVLSEVTKWYGQVIGINNVSLTVGPGVTGLLGPNGAGKSTIMKLITGQILPSQGEVSLCGCPPFFSREVKKRVGYVPELEALHDHETGHRFLTKRAVLRGYPVADANRIARTALDKAGLSKAADRSIGTYSRGMRQRIKLAQAIFHGPDVLILDEPLTALDPVGRREEIDLIRRMGDEGRCVLVSSHVLHEVEAMTDRVILIAHGKILAEGTIDHIRGLIDQHPHTVEIGTDDPVRLSTSLLEKGIVVSASLEKGPGQVLVKTRDPDRFYDVLCDLVVNDGLKVESLHSPDNNLQAVFNYLVK